MRRENRRFAHLFVCLLLSFAAKAQEYPAVVQSVIELMAEQGTDSEELSHHFSELYRRHLSVNELSRTDLERSLLFSPFQIESLLDYRKEYGDILSERELSLIDGFGLEAASICAAFFSFESTLGVGERPPEHLLRQSASLKIQSDYDGDGLPIRLKYSCEYGDRFEAGLTIDNDAGEKFPDFVSASAAFHGDGFLKDAFVGDYAPRFGQGLVVWKSFSFTTFGSPSDEVRNYNGIRRYSSSSESGFFRGAAATMKSGSLKLSLFASRHPVDARIVGDTAYTSIATDGLHRTETELAKRHSMHEYACGMNLDRSFGRFRIGLTAITYSYDKHNGRRVQDYNRLQMYDGLWGNAGVDFYWTLRRFRLFGEAAVDMGGSVAAIAGLLWSPSYSLEASLLMRAYPGSYIATHAGAYSTLSTCSNQRGLTLALKWLPSSMWSLRLNADGVYYPLSRYRVDGPSAALKSRSLATCTFDDGSFLDVRLKCTLSTVDSTSASIRLGGSYKGLPQWDISGRVEANLGGIASYIEGAWCPLNIPLGIRVRVTAYNTVDWAHRIYMYESGVPESFGVKALYGKGMGVYLLVRYTPIKWLELCLKASDSGYAFFIRTFIPG